MKENKQKILIVDDNFLNRFILFDILSDDYDILEASDGEEAVNIIKNHFYELSLILLDLMMPKINGYEVLKIMNDDNLISNLPVIIISSEVSNDSIESAYMLGAQEYIIRPFNPLIVTKMVKNTIGLFSKQRNLINLVNKEMYDRVTSQNIMVNILSHIVETKNGESGAHVLNINKLTDFILRKLVKKTYKYI